MSLKWTVSVIALNPQQGVYPAAMLTEFLCIMDMTALMSYMLMPHWEAPGELH